MCEFVFERFPEHAELISQLYREDADFQEMCADYEELATWLDARGGEDCKPEAECAEAGQVLESLEVEIITKIQSALGAAPKTHRIDLARSKGII